MNASASIFEALSDIDSKFTKIADKEYDLISAEVKKWFKKLAVWPLVRYLNRVLLTNRGLERGKASR